MSHPPTSPKEMDPPSENPQEVRPRGASPSRERETAVRQAELVISYVLRGGVLLSAAVMLGGVVFFYVQWFLRSGHDASSSFPHTLSSVEQGLAQGNPQAIIVLGLLMLLLTPVVRVAVSVVAFLLERDWRYVIITSLVLVILLLSFVLGKGGA